MLYKKKYLIKRKKIYKNISKFSKKNKIFNFNDLFYFQNITFIDEIQFLTQLYIKENLSQFYNKNFSINSFESEAKLISKLPNITPNGIINPRKETQKIYRLILEYIFKSINNISPFIKNFAIPVIRYKVGNTNKTLTSRPYATTKIHSDAWVGQSGDAIMSLGIVGDFKNNGVNFYYPEKISSNFFNKINDYDYGAKLYSKKRKIAQLQPKKWHLFDHSILHSSFFKKSAKARISIDFGVNISDKIDINSNKNKRWKYLSIKEFQKEKKCKFLCFNKSIHSTNF